MRVILEGAADFAWASACGRALANAGESRSGRKPLRFIDQRLLRAAETLNSTDGRPGIGCGCSFEQASCSSQMRKGRDFTTETLTQRYESDRVTNMAAHTGHLSAVFD